MIRRAVLVVAAVTCLVVSSGSSSGAQEWSAKGRIACHAWSGLIRNIAMASDKGYPPRAAMRAVEGSTKVDERLHRVLEDTVKGIYGGNRGIWSLAVSPGWTDACASYFVPKDLRW